MMLPLSPDTKHDTASGRPPTPANQCSLSFHHTDKIPLTHPVVRSIECNMAVPPLWKGKRGTGTCGRKEHVGNFPR